MQSLLRARAVKIGLFLGVPLSAVFLWLALRGADLGEVWDALREANAGLVVLAVAVNGLIYVGQAIRWRRVARTPEVSVGRFAEMVVSSIAVNDVLPGRIGDVLRARWLQVEARMAGGRALSTVFVDRAFDVFALVVFLLVSLPFVAGAAWLARIVVGGVTLLAAVVVVLVAARIYTRRRERERHERGFLRRVARDTIEGLADPLGRRRGLALAAISLATWSMWSLAALLVARAVGVELSAVDAFFLTGAINLGLAIPSSPGFIGTYQWLGVAALGLLGVEAEPALAFTILMHAVWFVPTLVVGGGLLARRGIRRMRRAAAGREARSQA